MYGRGRFFRPYRPYRFYGRRFGFGYPFAAGLLTGALISPYYAYPPYPYYY